MSPRPSCWIWLFALLLAAGMLAGCHTAPLPTVSASAQNSPGTQQLPFSTKTTGAPMLSPLPASITVPAGTAISVRLAQPLSSETAHAGETFHAVLDDPIQANGVTAAPSGSEITGRVLAVRRSGAHRAGGVLQLSLNTVTAGQHSVAIETSSVIASASGARSPGTTAVYAQGHQVLVGAERRLTFRLRQPAALPAVTDTVAPITHDSLPVSVSQAPN